MDRQKFRKEFIRELTFFNEIANLDLKKGFTIEQVEDELIKFSSSFYGARLDFDDYAVKKCYFIATYAYQIIKGGLEDYYFDELCDEIEEEKRVRSA
jgi:hypothetical protein